MENNLGENSPGLFSISYDEAKNLTFVFDKIPMLWFFDRISIFDQNIDL